MILEAYKNLRKNCFSLRFKGIVYAYREKFILKNAIFKVSQKGRDRVLKLKVKNVHAIVKGEFFEYNKLSLKNAVEISYNPYLFEFFYQKHDKKPIYYANIVLFNNDKVFAWI